MIGNQLLLAPVLPLRHQKEPGLGHMGGRHDHVFAVVDLERHAPDAAIALRIRLPSARPIPAVVTAPRPGPKYSAEKHQ